MSNNTRQLYSLRHKGFRVFVTHAYVHNWATSKRHSEYVQLALGSLVRHHRQSAMQETPSVCTGTRLQLPPAIDLIRLPMHLPAGPNSS